MYFVFVEIGCNMGVSYHLKHVKFVYNQRV